MMTTPHPWQNIPLDVYEAHMSDPAVAQLTALRTITGQQLADHAPRTVAILGIAAGNGLDLIDPATVTEVHGYDLNPDYLRVCEARHRDRLSHRLHLHHTAITQTLTLPRVDLVIANLIIEYIGLPEFAAFAAHNAESIGALSCVVQHNHDAGFVSTTAHAAAFDGLAGISNDIDTDQLTAELLRAGFSETAGQEHPLPNQKTLRRRDFTGSSTVSRSRAT